MRSTSLPYSRDGSFADILRTELRQLIADSAHMLVWWVAMTALAAVAAIGAKGSGYHQLGIAALLTSATLPDGLYFCIHANQSLYSGAPCHCGSVGSFR